MKKGFIRVMAFSLSVLVLAGCGPKNSVSNENATGEIPESLTIFSTIDGSVLKAGGKDRNDILTYKVAEKETGCHIEWTNPSPTAYGEQFNLLLASGEYPDILQYSWNYHSTDLEAYIEDGIILPMDDYIEYMPNFKKLLDEKPELRRQCSSPDGKILFAPTVRKDKELKIYVGPQMRHDWLEKLNLKAPTTPEELYNVLMAFKTQDPNGNGVADEIPFSGMGADHPDWGVGNVVWAFDTHYTFHIKDGKVKHGMMEPEMEEAMAYLNKLYSDGLIDVDVLINDREKLDSKFLNDKCGFMYGVQPSSFYNNMNDGTRKLAGIPHINAKAYTPSYVQDITNLQFVITSACKDPIGAAKWIDFFYSDKGMEAACFGEEGVSYEIVDGKPKYKEDYIFNNPNGKSSTDMLYLSTLIYSTDCPMIQTWEAYSQTLRPWGKESITTWTESADASGALPPLYLTAEESDEVARFTTDINTYVTQEFCNMMIGKTPLSDFAKVRAELEKMGMSKVLEIYNKAYERYLNN